MLLHRRAGAALALAALLLLSACGDSDDASSAADNVADADNSTPDTDTAEDTATDAEADANGDAEVEDEADADGAGEDSPPDTGVPPEVDPNTVFVASFDDAPAAAVEGQEISSADLFGELTNQLAAQEASTGTTGDSQNADGAFEANLASSVLSELIVSELVVQEIDSRGLEISTDEIEEVRAGVGPAPDGVDESFVENFVERQAQYQTLATDLYDVSGPVGVLECSRHVLVETEEEANAVIARLEDGEDFGEVATETSTDPSAAQNGGLLGCDVSSFVPAFAEAVQSLADGERSGPVATDFGFHVIEKISPSQDQIDAATQAARQDALRDWIVDRVASAEVSVDERIGSWDAVTGVIAIGSPDPGGPEILDESLTDN